MDNSLTVPLNGEEFVFDHRRAVYWPRRKVLLAADLHWGKTQYLRNHGIAVTDNVFEADLRRLTGLLTDYEVRTLLVLGDLVHHEAALSRGVVERVAELRDAYPCELLLVTGNHDRYTRFPPSWGVVEEPDFYIGDFYFTHEPVVGNRGFTFAGHLHPMLRLRAGFDVLRLPTFILGDGFCHLPAFSAFTGGQDVKIEKGQRALVLGDDGLMEFGRD
jgi:DNA ligase-associated metallophosphoesterase